MKFGKLDDLSGVDFSLPETPACTRARLGGQPATRATAAVGLPRWASPEWVGTVYPPGTRQRDYLYHYARAFDTIELNTTHYRIPTVGQVQAWREAVPAHFVFCPKIPQTISHYRKLINCDDEILTFTRHIAHFGENLGCCFLQLHESMGPAALDNLGQFLRRWPRELPLAVEFRHAAWFEAGALSPRALDLLEPSGVGTVITDVAGRRDVCHASLSNHTAMIRFVGNALHESDYQRTAAWLAVLREWIALGLERVYIFPHEPGDVLTADMGRHWIAQLREIEGLEQGGAADTRPLPGGQMSLF
ncbi:MAG: DUF72 domain-containing protein [Bacteroidia bacterium]